MAEFDVVSYIGSLVGYPVPRSSLERIATERNLLTAEDWTEISRRDRNLALADILMVIFTSPSNTGSRSRSHGDFSITIGGVILTDKNDLYALMMKLYENPDKELWENLKDVGGCSWML